ncbi:hypothetical protein [Polaromonas glacialis]|uniref:hypothetical protein n=1 Tax=Polaromonas glacialis TaxID=866564 RepID=UPI0004961138|nr:hypothetical protein [Polaromonas glacialis]
MTSIISPSARKADHTTAPTAITTSPAIGNIEHHQALDAAMLKAVRAASLLEHACTASATYGRA